jgi:hypothetical protein
MFPTHALGAPDRKLHRFSADSGGVLHKRSKTCEPPLVAVRRGRQPLFGQAPAENSLRLPYGVIWNAALVAVIAVLVIH